VNQTNQGCNQALPLPSFVTLDKVPVSCILEPQFLHLNSRVRGLTGKGRAGAQFPVSLAGSSYNPSEKCVCLVPEVLNTPGSQPQAEPPAEQVSGLPDRERWASAPGHSWITLALTPPLQPAVLLPSLCLGGAPCNSSPVPR
jgi:hypothetical protein